MVIRDLLEAKSVKGVKVIYPDDTIRQAARDLVAHNIGVLIVVNDRGKLAGIISERDVMRAIVEYDGGLVDKRVNDVMTRSVITCARGDGVADVLSLMKQNGIRHIPVLEGDELVGVISIRELIRAYEVLQEEANTDALTGLPNRRQFFRTLENEFDR